MRKIKTEKENRAKKIIMKAIYASEPIKCEELYGIRREFKRELFNVCIDKLNKKSILHYRNNILFKKNNDYYILQSNNYLYKTCAGAIKNSLMEDIRDNIYLKNIYIPIVYCKKIYLKTRLEDSYKYFNKEIYKIKKCLKD